MMPVTEYAEMKDSGMEWIQKIPSTWKVYRAKYLFREINERCKNSDEYDLLSVSEYYGIAPRREKIKESDFLTNAESLDGYKICAKGDLVINIMLAWKNSLGVSNLDGIVSPAYCVYRGKVALNPRYFHYLFRTKLYGDIFKRNSTGIIESRLRLYSEKFFNIKCPYPPVEEQTAIVTYLDSRCAQIDSMIAAAKANIEDYKALKQSVITQAVTKGLDPNVEMKDSGIEWIGKIEKDFTVVRLKHLLASPLQYGANESGLPYDETLPRYIRITDIAMNGYSLKNEGKLSLSNEAAKGYLLENNDILLARSGASAGKSFIYKALIGCAAFAGYLIRCRIDTMKALPEYVAYYTKSSIYEIWKSASYIQATIPNISAERYNNLPVIVPPLNKQYEIIQYLDTRCAQIDQLVEEQQALIEDLEAAKKSLIYECVTGKRKVPNCDEPSKNSTIA